MKLRTSRTEEYNFKHYFWNSDISFFKLFVQFYEKCQGRLGMKIFLIFSWKAIKLQGQHQKNESVGLAETQVL